MPSGGGRRSAYAMWLVNILSISSRYLYLQVPKYIFKCPQISLDTPKHLQMPTSIRKDSQAFANKVRCLELSSASSGLRQTETRILSYTQRAFNPQAITAVKPIY